MTVFISEELNSKDGSAKYELKSTFKKGRHKKQKHCLITWDCINGKQAKQQHDSKSYCNINNGVRPSPSLLHSFL